MDVAGKGDGHDPGVEDEVMVNMSLVLIRDSGSGSMDPPEECPIRRIHAVAMF